jgi:hypothetical protein
MIEDSLNRTCGGTARAKYRTGKAETMKVISGLKDPANQ